MKEIIGTVLSEYIWAGGEGADDKIKLIGYCKDMPIDVLRKIIQSHSIYLYRNIDVSSEYPSNVSGIIIMPLYEETIRGCVVTGRLEDFYGYLKKYKWDKFSLEDSKEVLIRQKNHNFDFTKNGLAELEEVLDELEPDDVSEGSQPCSIS